MEYERTEDGQIQAAFAHRVGQLLVQYEQWHHQVPAVERYESTLTIALLHSLLTMCQELLRKKRLPPELNDLTWLSKRSLEEEPTLLGLSSDCVQQSWPSNRGITYREVIECLRNALSHPCPQTSEGLPRTGFTTVPDASGRIQAYEFTQSPWVNSAGRDLHPRFFSNESGDFPPREVVNLVSRWAANYNVEGIDVQRVDGRWQPVRDGVPFIPVLRLRITVGQLRVFTAALSDYLSAPVRRQDATLAQPLGLDG